jgi:hypothetical protein
MPTLMWHAVVYYGVTVEDYELIAWLQEIVKPKEIISVEKEEEWYYWQIIEGDGLKELNKSLSGTSIHVGLFKGEYSDYQFYLAAQDSIKYLDINNPLEFINHIKIEEWNQQFRELSARKDFRATPIFQFMKDNDARYAGFFFYGCLISEQEAMTIIKARFGNELQYEYFYDLSTKWNAENDPLNLEWKKGVSEYSPPTYFLAIRETCDQLTDYLPTTLSLKDTDIERWNLLIEDARKKYEIDSNGLGFKIMLITI